MRWYYTRNGTQAGPVSSDQLKELISDGTIKSDESVWHKGLDDWEPISNFRGLLKPDNVPPPLPSRHSQNDQVDLELDATSVDTLTLGWVLTWSTLLFPILGLAGFVCGAYNSVKGIRGGGVGLMQMILSVASAILGSILWGFAFGILE